MNLEELNLVELNAQQIKETECGFLPLLVVGSCLLVSGCATYKPE